MLQCCLAYCTISTRTQRGCLLIEMPRTSPHDSSKFIETFNAASVETDAAAALLGAPLGVFVIHTGYIAELFLRLFCHVNMEYPEKK